MRNEGAHGVEEMMEVGQPRVLERQLVPPSARIEGLKVYPEVK
jgi:hypothetical protein